eukprot:COSAG01_NODE_2959_length_6793_cov_16.043771_4_plen_62_part_00
MQVSAGMEVFLQHAVPSLEHKVCQPHAGSALKVSVILHDCRVTLAGSRKVFTSLGGVGTAR